MPDTAVAWASATGVLLVVLAAVGLLRRKAASADQSGAGVLSRHGNGSPAALSTTNPGARPPSRWVPPAATVNVAGYVLRDGMIYVGEAVRAVRGGAPEPALINPRLPVNRSNPFRAGQGMSYWPSYSDISPENRAAYLEWLADGRRSPDAYIGYVFLFFYGLERRALIDSATDPGIASEMPRIIREVEELLAVYGHNGSFSTYAGGLLELCRWKFDPVGSATREPALFG